MPKLTESSLLCRSTVFSKLHRASLHFLNNKLVSPHTLRYSIVHLVPMHRGFTGSPNLAWHKSPISANPTCLCMSCLKLLPVEDFPSHSSIRKHIAFTSNPLLHPPRSISIKLRTAEVLLPTRLLETPADWMIAVPRLLLLAVSTHPI